MIIENGGKWGEKENGKEKGHPVSLKFKHFFYLFFSKFRKFRYSGHYIYPYSLQNNGESFELTFPCKYERFFC